MGRQQLFQRNENSRFFILFDNFDIYALLLASRLFTRCLHSPSGILPGSILNRLLLTLCASLLLALPRLPCMLRFLLRRHLCSLRLRQRTLRRSTSA
ncbi:hypothetical protein D3C78_1136650 [compost metagenome]